MTSVEARSARLASAFNDGTGPVRANSAERRFSHTRQLRFARPGVVDDLGP